MTVPIPMIEIPVSEHERLLGMEARAAEMEALAAGLREELGQRVQDLGVAVEQRDGALADRNNLRAALSDMEQERDRLRGLLLENVERLERFSPSYPNAETARTAFQGTAEQISEQMAVWENARQDQVSAYGALVNYVRTQATV